MSANLRLDDQEEAWLAGSDGRATQLAMRLMIAAAEVAGATRFVPVEFAHISSSFYAGQISVDFAEFLLAEHARLRVPSHTNASLIDCAQSVRSADQHPTEVAGAARLMEIYEAIGCSAMWSCAPYHQADGRPAFGSQIIGSESNAVSFFNSALGARTNKYGDFLDVCGAIVGRVPLAGLHTDEGRLATHVFRLDLDDDALADRALPHLIGILLGQLAGRAVPVIDGLGSAAEGDLKAIAAAAATSGAVEMFHVVGVTPEAPTLDDALGGRAPVSETVVGRTDLDEARARLSTTRGEHVDAVCVGTPHFSVDEFGELITALAGRRVAPGVRFLATTSRAVDHELQLRGWRDQLVDAGVEIVLDTCTYYTPRAEGVEGVVMTNSAKWAYYSPGMLGIDVVFDSLEACVESAVSGRVVR